MIKPPISVIIVCVRACRSTIHLIVFVWGERDVSEGAPTCIGARPWVNATLVIQWLLQWNIINNCPPTPFPASCW